jgi:hypothetical protein
MQSFATKNRKLSAKFALATAFLSANLLMAAEPPGVDTNPATSSPAPIKTLQSEVAEGNFDLSSGWKPGESQHVSLELEVGGHLTVTGDKKPQKLPMSVVAKLSYDETLLLSEYTGGRRLRSARKYDKAEAVIRVDKGGVTPKLPEYEQRLIVDIEKGHATIFNPAEPLTRDELDLIDVVGNSLALSEILPAEPVKIGQHWKAQSEAITALLSLDAIASSEIDSQLTGVDGDLAKITVQGTISGAAEGVATEIEIKAKYHFNLTDRRITGFNMAVKEKRSIGHVGPGVEVVAKLKMQLRGSETPADLNESLNAQLGNAPTPENTRLLQEAKTPGFRYLADRRWFTTNESDKLLILRYVERGDLIAQCNLTPLTAPDNPQDPLTLEKYQHEVREALGKNFGQFTKAGQWTDEKGQFVFRVIVQGQVETLPIEWRYYLVTHPSGKRVAAVYTIEGSLLDRFGDADRELVDTLELRADQPADKSQDTATKSVKVVK